jgi:thiol:disulfide interchange protein DsbD
MRFSFIVFFLSVAAGSLHAQILQPAKWKVAWSKQEMTEGEEVEVVFRATIDEGWYLYSTDFDPNLGPMVTEFKFEAQRGYKVVGTVVPVSPKKKYDETWQGEYTYFIKKAEFRQKVQVLEAGSEVLATVSYQVCTDADGKCIPFEETFSLKVPKLQKQKLVPPATDSQVDTVVETTVEKQEVELKPNAENDTIKPAVGNLPANVFGSAPSAYSGLSLWAFFFLAFGAGLIALLTPCVFPMIPMTVTFFTRSNQKRIEGIKQALFYGFSIIAIYTIIGTIVAKTVGPEAANFLSTHWLPNLFFFFIFLVFAASFLGMFEIVLPSWIVNSADKQADKGGYYGVFFMAFTIVLVSFSCTGPIVGSILVESASGANLKPIVGMFGFSLAFAIPFTLFAIFPSWLSNLPKSGGWLNTVKVVLGFLELALAFKFLSIADQVYHWGILDRDVFLAIWIATFALMGVYLLGGFRLPHDSPLEKLSVGRLLLAVVTFSFVMYLMPGMWGAPLKTLTGYLPPMTSQDFDLSMQKPSAANTVNATGTAEQVRFAELFKLPHQLNGYFDFNQAMQAARAQQKPIFIDFTGHGCVNCREMEARVWSHPQVLKYLQNDFVVVALYVDDKTELPEAEWITSTYDGKVKKTIGSINATLQITRYNNNAQPFYVLLSPDGSLLAEPKAYDLEPTNFVTFLKNGLEAFRKSKL